MTLNTKEQELLDTWNKIQEGKKNGENVNAINYNFQSNLTDLIDTQVREEGGDGTTFTDEDTQTLNAYNKLFNYEIEYGFRCSYNAYSGDYDHEGECNREELVSYIDGSDEPEEPDFRDLIYSCEWDMNFDSNGDLTPQISVFGIKLKEIYQDITPKNSVAPIQETKKFTLVLEIEDTSTEDKDPDTYASGVKDYLNFADNGYKVVSAKVGD